jgi:exodeoxyribonuclease VII small subunit
VAKDSRAAPAPTENYGEVVAKLESVVKRLEAGELSLEDSLREFEEGIRLVRQGEKLLGAAERRVEQLLQEDASERTVPLEGSGAPKAAPLARPPGRDDGDIPF